MSPGGNSRDPAKRARSLANLQRGGGVPASAEHRPSLQHGGYAQVARERLEARELEVFEALAADVPLRGPDGDVPRHDAVVVRLFAEALCRLDDVKAHIGAHGWADRKGNPRPVVELEARLRREALEYAEALGCTPRSRAKLGLDLTLARDLATAGVVIPSDEARAREVMQILAEAGAIGHHE